MATKEKESLLDIFLKILTPIITVVSILIGVWQYNDAQRNNELMEFKRNIWLKQQQAYEEIGNIVSNVVNSTDDTTQFNQNLKKFREIYWGKLVLVEDDSVEIEMIKFNAETQDFKEGVRNKEDLMRRGYKLIKTCKKSINSSWKKLNYYE
ncbi:MAG: hypothetical protein MUE85_07020 [Microscillaceae bacterium]|jgi:hypothetical protein|nr:hypothetical protein [Microscillaceae bacterium]